MSEDRIAKLQQLAPQLYGPNCDTQIKQYFDEMKNYYLTNTDKFHELFHYLLTTNSKHFKFWLVDMLIQIITQKYGNMSKATKDSFRQSLLNIFNSNFEKIFDEPFVTNKYCVLFNKFIFYDFPENNNTIFNDIFSNIFNTQEFNQKLSKLFLLLQIFEYFNEEYIQFKHTYNKIQQERSKIIKDYLRLNTITNLLQIIKQILENEENIPNEKIIKKSLVIISQLIDWIPLEFFIDVFKIILTKLIKKYKYYKECCDVLYMIVKKGMEPKLKRDILDQIALKFLIKNILDDNRKTDSNTLERIANIIDLIGNFIIEYFNYIVELIKNNNNNRNNIMDDIKESFNWSCDALRYYFYFFEKIIYFNNQINYTEALILSKSLNSIVLYLKSNDTILNNNTYVMDSFKNIFNVINKNLKIPENQYYFDEDLYELQNEEDFFKLRSEFRNIYKNIYNINILKEYIIDSVINYLRNLLHIKNEQEIYKINVNNINKYDIEFCLYLLNILQEEFKISDLNNNNNIQRKIIGIYNILFSFPFTKIDNADYILLSYYDTINKGMEIIINNKDAISYIIELYISTRGLFYNGKEFYQKKIVSYFDKFLSKLISKNKIKVNLDFDILFQEINKFLNQLLDFIKKTNNFENLKKYTLLFHSYGVIITYMNDLEKKNNNFITALKLFDYMIKGLYYNNNSQLNEIICELILGCFIQFIEAFGAKIKSNEIKKILIDFFNNFINNYCNKIINNKNSSLLLKYIYFMQKLVILLGEDSLKYLDSFFQNNISLNYNTFCDYIKLLQNMINNLKKNSKILVKKTFNTFFQYIYQFIQKYQFPKDDISEENKIVVNKLLDFIKTFNCMTLYIPEIFFENNGIDNLNFVDLIRFILDIGKNVFETEQRKTIITPIQNLCDFFRKNKNSFEKQQFFANILVDILNGLFIIYSKINKEDKIFISCTVEIAKCHLFMNEFGPLYNNYLLKYLSKEEVNQFIELIKKVDYKKKIKPSEYLLLAFDHITRKLLT